MAWTYTGNQTNGSGDVKCPGCPLTADVGFPCIHGTLQQQVCIPQVQAGQAFATFRAKNVAAWQTEGTASEIHQSEFIDGDYNAYNPLGPGPGAGGSPVEPV